MSEVLAGCKTECSRLHAKVERLERSNKELREALNQFDNPYLVGNVWKWFGPTPEAIDTVLSSTQKSE